MTADDASLPPAPGNEDTEKNVEGMAPAPPREGFGRLWLKTLEVTLEHEVSPEDLSRRWRNNLLSLWPEGGEIFRSWRGIEPGEMAGIDLQIGPMTMSTGVVVTNVTPTSWTFQSPEGHMLAGRITFSTRSIEGKTVAQVEIVMRANDPFYELGLGFGGHRKEEKFWANMLWNVAALYGERPPVRLRRQCLDRRRQWRKVVNIRKNAAIRTFARKSRRTVSSLLHRSES